MIGLFYIDGINAYETYNVFVKQNSFAGLIEYPQFKQLESNDWAEYDGIEVDLSNPVLDSKEITITFISDSVGFVNFMKLITETVYHDFYFPALDKTFRLRAIKQTSNSIVGVNEFGVQFSDDNPMDGYIYENPTFLAPATSYFIDDIDLSNYGLRILNGTEASIFTQGDIKEQVFVDLPTTKGLKYGIQKLEFVTTGETPTTILPDNVFKAKEANINCLLKCSNIVTFWKSYNAFVYNLIQPGERVLTSGRDYDGIPFHYNGIQVNDFFVSTNTVWCNFSLSLVQTRYRLQNVVELLSTEDEYLILTEDNNFIAI